MPASLRDSVPDGASRRRSQTLPDKYNKGEAQRMSTFVDRELGAGPPGTCAGPSRLSRRPVCLTAPKPARRRLATKDAVVERAATGPAPVWGDWAAAQSRIRTTAPSAESQSLLLVGELDVATAVLGGRQLREALETGRGPLVLDCSRVRFIDAAWLGLLVGTARYGAQLGRKVTVAAPSPRVLRVLRLIGLEWLMGDE